MDSFDGSTAPTRQTYGWKTKILSPESDQAICDQYLDGATSDELAVTWGIGKNTVLRTLKRNEIQTRQKGARRIHTCDDHFFDSIDSETKAYWLGFFAADGCVTGRSRVHIGLQRRDHHHLEKFKESLQATNPVKTGKSSSGFPTSYITITSKTLSDSLKSNGIMERKTYNLEWPHHIDQCLLRHYLRGYFDGDGSASTGVGCKKRKNDNRQWQYALWSIVGNRGFCQSAQGFLVESLNLNYTKIREHRISSGIAGVEYGGPLQVARIGHFLYDDATVYLPRKRDKIAHLL